MKISLKNKHLGQRTDIYLSSFPLTSVFIVIGRYSSEFKGGNYEVNTEMIL